MASLAVVSRSLPRRRPTRGAGLRRCAGPVAVWASCDNGCWACGRLERKWQLMGKGCSATSHRYTYTHGNFHPNKMPFFSRTPRMHCFVAQKLHAQQAPTRNHNNGDNGDVCGRRGASDDVSGDVILGISINLTILPGGPHCVRTRGQQGYRSLFSGGRTTAAAALPDLVPQVWKHLGQAPYPVVSQEDRPRHACPDQGHR